MCRNNDVLQDLLDATQVRAFWAKGHPLPLPTWDPRPKDEIKFDSVIEYERFVAQAEGQLQQLLEEHNYNTVGNFLRFYQGFSRSGCLNLSDYMQRYYLNVYRHYEKVTRVKSC